MITGRTREISKITEAVGKRKNLFVWGEKGTGKTLIVKYVLGRLKDKNVLYCYDSATLKSSLLWFLKDDFDARFLLRQNIPSLKKLFYKKAKRKHPYFVFDHIKRVSPKFFSFFDNILDDYSALIIARGADSAHIGHLSLLLCFFDRLEVANLGRRHAYELIDYFIDALELDVNGQDYFKKEVFGVSRGNPSIIEGICRYAKDNKCRIRKDINFNILSLDRKISSLKL